MRQPAGNAMSDQADGFDAVKREAERIAKELDIPPCPAILARFNREFNSMHPDLRRMAALICNDIGLSAALLKTVNSPFYGLSRKAASVEQALSILGLRTSVNLVSGLLLRRAFPTASGDAIERFWDGSLRIAGLAASLAARLKNPAREAAHTYVLFRDCGMLVMLRKFPLYAGVMQQCANVPGIQFTRIEDSHFRFNHARVAGALARSWSLPEPLCGAIACHHDISMMERNAPWAEPPDPKLVAFGLLAEQIAALHDARGLCPDWPAAERFVLRTLGIRADDIVALAEDLLGVAA